MTIQMSTTLRNARLDQIETTIGTAAVILVFSGAQPANCAAADSGTLLAEFDLVSDWAANAASASKALNGLPLSTTGVATGTAGHVRIKDTPKTTCHMQGSIGTSGTDFIIDNTSIVTSQTCQITAFSFAEPGA